MLALDWNNGNRTILVDQRLTGLLLGQTLYTTPAEIYRALIEATAFGALTIINRFEEYGVKIEQVVNCGGIAEKSPLTMQIYADVTGRPMKMSRSAQTLRPGRGHRRRRGGGRAPGFRLGAEGDDRPEAEDLQAGPEGARRLSRTLCALPHAARRLRHQEWQGNLYDVMKTIDRHPQPRPWHERSMLEELKTASLQSQSGPGARRAWSSRHGAMPAASTANAAWWSSSRPACPMTG